MPLIARRVDHHDVLEAVVQLLDGRDQPKLVRRREVAEVPCAKELHQEAGDEPARKEMIRLKFVPRSLGASGCCLPGLDRCLELRPEILFLRSGECTGRTCSGVTARFIPPALQSEVGRSSALRVLFKDLGMNLALFGDLRLRSNLKTYDDVRVAVDTIPVLLREG